MIYVCSDIHGCLSRYQEVINKINEDDHLYILGDIIDRGVNGISIFLDVIKRNNVTVLMGNHELMMYQALVLKNKLDLFNWIHPQNGGRVTLNDFNRLEKETKQLIIEYLKQMPLYVTLEINDKKYYLSHGRFIKPIDNDIATIETIGLNDAFNIVWKSPFASPPIVRQYEGYDVYLHGHKFVQHYLGTNQYEALIWQTNDKFDQKIEIIDLDGGCATIANKYISANSLILYNLTNNSYEYFFSLDKEIDD